MSKTLTRKGIALGTAVAFVAALLTGVAPANALTSTGYSLGADTPVSGNLLNGIKQSGVEMVAGLPNAAFGAATASGFSESRANNTSFCEASDPDGLDATAWTYTRNESAYLKVEVRSLASTFDASLFAISLPNIGTTIPTSSPVSAVLVSGASNDAQRVFEYKNTSERCNLSQVARTLSDIRIAAPDLDGSNSNIPVRLSIWFDADGDNVADSAEKGISGDFILYDEVNVSGTISLAQPVLDAKLVGTLALSPGLGINPFFVASGTNGLAQYGTAIFGLFGMNGSPITTDGNDRVSFAVSNTTGVLTTTSLGTSGNAGLANYTVQAFYYGRGSSLTGTQTFRTSIAGPTAFSGIVAGISEAVSGVVGTITDTTTNVRTASTGVYRVKTGTTSVALNVQAKTGATNATDLAYANLRFKAVMTAPASTSASFAGGTSVTSTGAPIELFGRSDSKGQSVITITNPAAAAGQNVTVDLYVLDKDGEWVSYNNDVTRVPATGDNTKISISWENAVLNVLDVPVRAVSGDPATFKFSVLDQFGGGINVYNGSNALSLTVVAVDAFGNRTPAQFRETIAVPANGEVSVSVKNYALVGGSVRLQAFLHYSATAWDQQGITLNNQAGTAISPVTLTVYNNAPTSEVTTVENSYAGEVTYLEFSAITTTNAGANDVATVMGTVETNTGVGAAAQAVTVSGNGLYFQFDPTGYSSDLDYDGSFALNSITVYTDIDGKFTFRVFAHKVGAQSVTITSGGKSATVALTVAHNRNLVASAANNVLSFSWAPNYKPALGVSVVSATFKDKWGNPVQGATVAFNTGLTSGDDFVFLDGVNAATRTTDANGKTSLVRVRSFSTGRLQAPGMIDVDVTALTQRTANLAPAGVNDVALFDVSAVPANVTNRPWMGFFGTQATAKAGANKGKVVVTVYNAVGRKIHVFAGAKLLRTVEATKRVHQFPATTKSGERNISVRVGKNVAKNTLLTKVIIVK